MTDSRPRIAVFIEAGNIGLTNAPPILRFLARAWDTYLKRAYGWHLSQHQTILRENGIVLIEVAQNTREKNAAAWGAARRLPAPAPGRHRPGWPHPHSAPSPPPRHLLL